MSDAELSDRDDLSVTNASDREDRSVTNVSDKEDENLFAESPILPPRSSNCFKWPAEPLEHYVLTKARVLSVSNMWKIDKFNERLHYSNRDKVDSELFPITDSVDLQLSLCYRDSQHCAILHYFQLHVKLVSAQANRALFRACVVNSTGHKSNLIDGTCDSFLMFDGKRSYSYDWFIEYAELNEAENFRPRESLVANNTLTIQWTVTLLLDGILDMADQHEDIDFSRVPRYLHPNFGGLPRDGPFSDLTIRVGDREFRAHRVVLAGCSPVFGAMLESDMKEARDCELVIEDFDVSTVDKMLSFMYTGDKKVACSAAADLLPIANKYDVETLMLICEQELARTLDVNNAVDMWLFARKHNADHLAEAAMSVIRKDFDKVFNAEACDRLKNDTQKNFVEILKCFSRMVSRLYHKPRDRFFPYYRPSLMEYQ